MSIDQLDAALIAAHEKGDLAQLVELYSCAAKAKLEIGDRSAASFYYTHAYVFALENDHFDRANLHSILKTLGAEQ